MTLVQNNVTLFSYICFCFCGLLSAELCLFYYFALVLLYLELSLA